MRILFVQYAGDYLEAYRRLQSTGKETYYGHRYVLDQLERLQTFGEVAMMCCLSPVRYEERLPNGITVIGARAHPKKNPVKISQMMNAWNPTHVVVLGPLPIQIRWATSRKRRVMCMMADSFNTHSFLQAVKNRRLVRLLNSDRVGHLGNHGINACHSLARIGVNPDKIVAWDYPHTRRPSDLQPRKLNSSGVRKLLYVGAIQAHKGVGDSIDSVAELKRRGMAVRLQLAGDGDIKRFRKQALKSGVSEDVEFLGLVPNSDVFERMREVDVVVIPSHHQYPEGLPLTIYEALCARTPIVASDHPMFRGHLVDRRTAMVFPARQPIAMADSIEKLVNDHDLYATLSTNSASAWEGMQIPTKWGDVLYHWLRDTEVDREWLINARPQALND